MALLTDPDPGPPPSDQNPDFIVVGDASYNATSNEFTLTPDANDQAGAAMSESRLDLGDDFEVTFDVFLGTKDAGADGMAFVLHNSPQGNGATGAPGVGLGAAGIGQGVGIEFDTYFNYAFVGDIATDHTNFFDTDSAAANKTITGAVDLGNIEDGQWHGVRVVWDTSVNQLNYWFDDQLVGTLDSDIAAQYLGGSSLAYFGFTASTGGKSNLQKVRDVALLVPDPDPDPDPPPSDQNPDFTVVGDASYNATSNEFTLTPDANDQAGAAMSESRLDLGDDFEVTFDVFLGTKDAGADGMAFVLHNSPQGNGATGAPGVGLGAAGIGQGVGIEFDTYFNYAFVGDIATDHTNFFDTDSTAANKTITGAVDLGNIEDGQWHGVRVLWDTSVNQLNYWFDDQLVGTLDSDIAAQYLGGSSLAYFGFTASTGGKSNLQKVRDVALLVPDPDPDPPPSDQNPDFIVAGDASYNATSNEFTLTPDANDQVGAAMSENPVDMRKNFEITFDLYAGSKDAGADGMAFVLHDDALGNAAIGGPGAGLGAAGIDNGIGIEFDTFFNYSTFGDIATDHTNFFDTDRAVADKTVTSAYDLGNIEDSQWHDVRVTWDASTKDLSYWFDGEIVGSLSSDVAAQYLGGADFAYYGFTASTGGKSNVQQVRDVTLSVSDPDPAPPPSGQNGDFVVRGNASYNATSDEFTLTPDANDQVGAIMSNSRVDVRDDFDIVFNVYLGTKNDGADGSAFVLHNSPLGNGATGAAGVGLGAAGIVNGIGIEFDTYFNGSSAGDIGNDHTNFFDTDSASADKTLTNAYDLGDIEKGQWHDVRVNWDASLQRLAYWFDGQQIGSLSGDIGAEYLGGADFAYFGFTASTGGKTNLQKVEVTAIDGTFESQTNNLADIADTDLIL